MGVEEELCGGPLNQAEEDGIFDAVAAEYLLILSEKERRGVRGLLKTLKRMSCQGRKN